MGIKTIIFDLGNVLVKVDPKKSILKVRELVPKKSLKEIRQLINNSEIKRQYELGEMDDREFYNVMKEILLVDFSFNVFKDIWQDFFTPIQPMIDFLPSSKKSHCLVMLSDTNPMHVAICREQFDFFHDISYGNFHPPGVLLGGLSLPFLTLRGAAPERSINPEKV